MSQVGATLGGMEIIDQAQEHGYELDEKPLDGIWVWAWRRGDDERHPCFLTEREALSFMEDRVRRSAVLESTPVETT